MLVWRSVASNAITLLIVGLAALGTVVTMGQNTYRAPGPVAEAVCVSVARGSSMVEVSENLQQQGVIDRPFVFRLGADYTGKAEELKAGNFLIPPRASMEEIVEAVTASGASTCGSDINLRIGVAASDIRVREIDPATGEYTVTAEAPVAAPLPEPIAALIEEGFAQIRVTVAEGATSWQVTETLAAAPFLEGDVGPLPAEGSLAPGSYEVSEARDRAALLDRMRAAQEATLAAAWAGRSSDLPLANAYEALILASIIEKETGVAEERRVVSSVFVNRLRRGMRLQTDPTVIYGVTEGRGVLGRGLRQSELRQATPFNTYVIEGLPPTPIANPGRAAIEAAVDPDLTPYLFFVADGTGGHAFAETLAEHNENVARWREIERQRSQ